MVSQNANGGGTRPGYSRGSASDARPGQAAVGASGCGDETTVRLGVGVVRAAVRSAIPITLIADRAGRDAQPPITRNFRWCPFIGDAAKVRDVAKHVRDRPNL